MTRFSCGISWEMWSLYVWMSSLFSVNSSYQHSMSSLQFSRGSSAVRAGPYKHCTVSVSLSVLTVLKWCPMMMSTRLLVQPLSCRKQKSSLLITYLIDSDYKQNWNWLQYKFTIICWHLCVTLEAAQSIQPLAQGSTLIRTKPSTKLGSFS